MPNPSHLMALLLAAVALLAPTADADIIILKGGRIEGKVVKRENGRVTIRTKSGITTTVSAVDVLAVEKRQTPGDIYRAMARTLKPGDAQGHYALAIWCRDHGLKDEATNELDATLSADPDHEEARRELGHVKTDKGWLTRDQAMRAKGMVRVDGRWLTRAEAARLQAQRRVKNLSVAINQIVYQIVSTRKLRSLKWEAKLASIDDPAAADRILSLLGHRTPGVRRAACTSLARMNHLRALPKLVGRVLFDPDETVRNAATRAMLALSKERAAEHLYKVISDVQLTALRSRSDQRAAKLIYRRIARALGLINDLRSVPFLIQILYPSIQVSRAEADPQTGTSGVRNLGMYRAGGGPTAIDVTQGGTLLGTGEAEPVPRPYEKRFFNQDAEDVLKKLTGQDLGVIPRDWDTWWQAHGSELIRKREAADRADPDKIKKLIEGNRDKED